MLKTLAIETSCDDTSVAIVGFDGQSFFVNALLAYSQIQDHQQYGGVVPEIASRIHSEKIIEVIKNIGLDKIRDIDVISVTTHPGLPGSLIIGKTVASLLSFYFSKPLIQVNHIYGHIFSLFLERKLSDIQLPLVVLTASGGHNDIYFVVNDEGGMIYDEKLERKIFGGYKIARIGYTLDDAAGECFDKVARMLGGPYPGGAWIYEKSLKGKPNDKVKFNRIFLSKDSFEFSFSGMKSQVSFLLRDLETHGKLKFEHGTLHESDQLICDIAYEFQEAVVEVMVKKLVRAGIAFNTTTLGLVGGVSGNDRLREYLQEYIKKKLPEAICYRPTKKIYTTDNAAMIGVAGLLNYAFM